MQRLKTFGNGAKSIAGKKVKLVPALAAIAIGTYGVSLIFLPAGLIFLSACLFWLDYRL